jgi:hypothetical protein
MLEFPIARAYADARVTTIYGGPTEIMNRSWHEMSSECADRSGTGPGRGRPRTRWQDVEEAQMQIALIGCGESAEEVPVAANACPLSEGRRASAAAMRTATWFSRIHDGLGSDPVSPARAGKFAFRTGRCADVSVAHYRPPDDVPEHEPVISEYRSASGRC